MINIQDIIPFMKKGWIAMDEDGSWYWFNGKPKLNHDTWRCGERLKIRKAERLSNTFDIAPADDWTKSLIKLGVEQ